MVDVDLGEEDLLLPVFTDATGTGDVDVRITVVVAPSLFEPGVMTETDTEVWD